MAVDATLIAKIREGGWQRQGRPFITWRSLHVMLEYAGFLLEVCRSAVKAGKAVMDWLPDKFSSEERELLIAAAQCGKFELHHQEGAGVSVLSDGQPFPAGASGMELADPMLVAIYLEAFTSLCQKGLIVPESVSNGDFRLTGTGFKLARKLAGKA